MVNQAQSIKTTTKRPEVLASTWVQAPSKKGPLQHPSMFSMETYKVQIPLPSTIELYWEKRFSIHIPISIQLFFLFTSNCMGKKTSMNMYSRNCRYSLYLNFKEKKYSIVAEPISAVLKSSMQVRRTYCHTRCAVLQSARKKDRRDRPFWYTYIKGILS